ncbi:SRPBCC family protein [Ferrovibrio terrae]|uniref:SRPBCC family protein n=1 Tax=Ferrovibrio terrae TaxID=2594003 RepID=UPI0031384832
MPAAASPRPPLPCRHLSVTIRQPAAAVYGFLKDPANWPRWADGLGSLERRHDGRWIATQADGSVVTVVFTAPNDFGVLDHTVTTPDGTVIHVPLRVIANGDGAEVILTLFRLPTMDDATWARDEEWVRKDLERLSNTLQNQSN